MKNVIFFALFCLVFCNFGCGGGTKPVDLKAMNGFLEKKIEDREAEILKLKGEKNELQVLLTAEKTAKEELVNKLHEQDKTFILREQDWLNRTSKMFNQFEERSKNLDKLAEDLKHKQEALEKKERK